MHCIVKLNWLIKVSIVVTCSMWKKYIWSYPRQDTGNSISSGHQIMSIGASLAVYVQLNENYKQAHSTSHKSSIKKWNKIDLEWYLHFINPQYLGHSSRPETTITPPINQISHFPVILNNSYYISCWIWVGPFTFRKARWEGWAHHKLWFSRPRCFWMSFGPLVQFCPSYFCKHQVTNEWTQHDVLATIILNGGTINK